MRVVRIDLHIQHLSWISALVHLLWASVICSKFKWHTNRNGNRDLVLVENRFSVVCMPGYQFHLHLRYNQLI